MSSQILSYPNKLHKLINKSFIILHSKDGDRQWRLLIYLGIDVILSKWGLLAQGTASEIIQHGVTWWGLLSLSSTKV